MTLPTPRPNDWIEGGTVKMVYARMKRCALIAVAVHFAFDLAALAYAAWWLS